jgi:plasmid maintenance system antidote protein VapI
MQSAQTMINEKEMFNLLKEFIEERGTQRIAARDLGISQPYLSDILLRNRDVSDPVARKLGFTKVTMYVPLKDK